MSKFVFYATTFLFFGLTVFILMFATIDSQSAVIPTIVKDRIVQASKGEDSSGDKIVVDEIIIIASRPFEIETINSWKNRQK